MRLLSEPLPRLGLLCGASSLYAFCVAGGVINGSELIDYAAFYGAPYFTALWAADDSRQSHYWPGYHYGLWLVFLAPFLTIQYVKRTRGRAGVALALYLCGVALAPYLASYVGWFFYEDLPDFR